MCVRCFSVEHRTVTGGLGGGVVRPRLGGRDQGAAKNILN